MGRLDQGFNCNAGYVLRSGSPDVCLRMLPVMPIMMAEHGRSAMEWN
jgi:hypothetical protein